MCVLFVRSHIWYPIRCVCSLQFLNVSVYMHEQNICVCWNCVSGGRACVCVGGECTGREPVNKSVWGLGVWGWNMVPRMWSNVKNSATPGNNKSPDVASPQNKYTPLYKSSIWTMSRNKDAPDTSPKHTLTQKPCLFTHLFICLFVWIRNCLWEGLASLFVNFFMRLFLSNPLSLPACSGGQAGWICGSAILTNDQSCRIKWFNFSCDNLKVSPHQI